MYYYTNNLKHSRSKIVAFNKMNKYPFFVDQHSDYMKISKSGTYEIIYTDFYRGHGTIVLYDETNDTDLTRVKLVGTSGYEPFTFHSIFQINLTDVHDHNEISIFYETTRTTVDFFGGEASTFYIKYLHD